jgi:hypothetical protein
VSREFNASAVQPGATKPGKQNLLCSKTRLRIALECRGPKKMAVPKCKASYCQRGAAVVTGHEQTEVAKIGCSCDARERTQRIAQRAAARVLSG